MINNHRLSLVKENSHNNILDLEEQNQELLARLWDGVKRKGIGKCYCPCGNCSGFNRRVLNIT